MTNTEERVDIVIIGAGPGGSTAASLLRMYRPELRVVVLERETFPRPHVGESMLPNSNSLLAKLGLLDAVDTAGFVRKGGVAYKWRRDRECLLYRFAEGHVGEARSEQDLPNFTWQVDRSSYDALILGRARELGADIREGVTVVDAIGNRDGVEGVVYEDPAQGRRRLLASHVIDASGQARILGRALDIPRVEHDLGDLAIYRYYSGVGWNEAILATPELSNIFFAATATGWIWYIPLSRDVVSVGLVCRREFVREHGVDALFEAELATVSEMQALLTGATQIPEPGGTGPARTLVTQNWSYAHAEVAGPGWFLVGDAAAFVDPVLSSGVMLAHNAGMWAANAINTLLDSPELAEPLARDYNAMYSDARAGFVEMARWWYHSRDLGAEDWWRTAGVLTRKMTGAVPLDDRRAFIDLLAGYLTDSRFGQIDLSFGADALATCLMPLGDVEGAEPKDSEQPRTHRLEARWDAVELGRFYGTHVDDDRWRPLAHLQFSVADAAIDYRPPVAQRADGSTDTQAVLRTLSTVLDLARQGCVMGDVAHECHARIGDEHQDLPEQMLTHLLQLGIVGVSEHRGPLLVERGDIHDRSRLLVRNFDAHQTNWREVPELGSDRRDRLPTMVFTKEGEAVGSYRPPVTVEIDGSSDAEPITAALVDLLDQCDGQPFEQCVRSGRERLQQAGLGPERAHMLANTMLGELVALELLALR